MKNERTNKRRNKILTYFCIFLLVVVASVGLALGSSQNKVKADTPELYYFDADYSHDAYLVIILYMLDIDPILEDDTCEVGIYKGNKATFQFSGSSQTAEFVRYSQLDYDDYVAYIWSYNYPDLSTSNQSAYNILLYSSNSIRGASTIITSNYIFPYYPTFQQYYDEGQEYGYDLGVEETTETLNQYWNDYIDDTYISTSGSGYQEIYQRGRTDGINANIGTQNWFVASFQAVDAFLNIRIFPNITFGTLLGIPFVISVVWFIIRIFRGGGSD